MTGIVPFFVVWRIYYDNVSDGEFIVFDDYYAWDGATIAVHEFLATRKLAHPIETVVGRGGPVGASLRKTVSDRHRLKTWQLRLEAATRRIMQNSSFGDVIIVAGPNRISKEVCAGRRVLPFLERDGDYWGPPNDTATAIAEIERVRIAGYSHIAFLWEEFWWLDYYVGLDEQLRSKYRLVSEDNNAIIFSLTR